MRGCQGEEGTEHKNTEFHLYDIHDVLHDKGIEQSDYATLDIIRPSGVRDTAQKGKPMSGLSAFPDKWFNNVEVIVAERIGMETHDVCSEHLHYVT